MANADLMRLTSSSATAGEKQLIHHIGCRLFTFVLFWTFLADQSADYVRIPLREMVTCVHFKSRHRRIIPACVVVSVFHEVTWSFWSLNIDFESHTGNDVFPQVFTFVSSRHFSLRLCVKYTQTQSAGESCCS